MSSAVSDSSTTDKHPHLFEEFFNLDREESASPFLTPSARRWSSHLPLKISTLSAVLLLIAFILSYYPSFTALGALLLLGVYFFAGTPALIEAIEDLANGEVNIDVLMTLAAFSSILIGSSIEGGLLLVLFAISGSLEEFISAKAKGSIQSLYKLSPSTAFVIAGNDRLVEKSVKDIEVGTLILIKAGEIVPLDGVVVEGASSVNLVHLTGENLPVPKKKGDIVPAGARNREGALTLQATHNKADSTLAKIIELATAAREAKPKLQRWFDTLSKAYALTIIALASVFSLSFPFLFNIPFLGPEGSIYRSLAFLIAASPCALILALPIAYLSAISACARSGILLKGGITLDLLASCSMIAFDKTGTLTTGNLRCIGIEEVGKSLSSYECLEALDIAYAMERNTVHPFAKAICSYAERLQRKPAPIKNFESVPGYGLQAVAPDAKGELPAFIGLTEYLLPNLSPVLKDAFLKKTEEIRKRGELIAAMLLGERIFIFRFLDTLRPHIKETIRNLRKAGKWRMLMLSGDHEYSAKHIADLLGIEEYYANLRPENKLDHITRLAHGNNLVMIGDGINDAPALARASVGICMGKAGSGTAIEAADVILLHDNLDLLHWLLEKARQTQTIVKQNLFIALAAIGAASIPAITGAIPLWLAVVMHEGGAVLVGFNALRLLSSGKALT